MGSILRGMYGEHSVGRSGAAHSGAAQLAEGTLVLDYEAAAGTTVGVTTTSHATPAASPLAPSPASARAVAVAVRSSPLGVGVGVGVGGAAASSSPAAPQVR